MLVIIYIASMAVLMLTFSVCSARERDRVIEATFAGAAGVLLLLAEAILSGFSLSDSEHVFAFIVHALHLVVVLLLLDAVVVKRKPKIYH